MIANLFFNLSVIVIVRKDWSNHLVVTVCWTVINSRLGLVHVQSTDCNSQLSVLTVN